MIESVDDALARLKGDYRQALQLKYQLDNPTGGILKDSEVAALMRSEGMTLYGARRCLTGGSRRICFLLLSEHETNPFIKFITA